MLPFPRLSPAVRGNLFIAAIPLALSVITHAYAELEAHIAARGAELAKLEARIIGLRAELDAYTPEPAMPGPADFDDTPPGEPADTDPSEGGHVDTAAHAFFAENRAVV